ncbi:MAG: hypothetical protein DRO94_00085 [Candidatus Altiarchaeales archaeon]|nr:MAG: hypothetical protein DRO95_06470 [Candidatus Altiarchaeales archaeon]RLI95611.1 MAG: hypothetical protein DRO94_00085 [Candidatus Altiarchaeales archaeon]HDO82315.1 DedA family protein [Candidatus Altiarchaeales archaeon]HEX54964.1 DedA family protein [Candidatus Altiarchaeales archaeon]
MNLNFGDMKVELPVGRILLIGVIALLILGIIFALGLVTMSQSLEFLIKGYGYLGIFIASFFGSTIFVPFAIEFLLPPLSLSLDPITMVIIASLGSMSGTWVNYGLGFIGSEIIKKKIEYEKMEHAKHIMNKYGWFGLFIILILPFPLPVDPITIVPGIAKMNFLEFSIVVFVGKFVKYSIYLEIFSLILRILHI